MDRVAIWGMGNYLSLNLQTILMHEINGDFEIIGFIDKNIQRTSYCGKRIYSPDIFFSENVPFDYIIIMADKFARDIFNDACIHFCVDRELLIIGETLSIPFFRWNKYTQLRKKQPSIISESCLGGGIKSCFNIATPFSLCKCEGWVL